MINAIEFLTDQQRRDVLDKIFQLKLFWKTRKPMFKTLGAALYLDAALDFKAYQRSLRINNCMLRENFPFLYPLLKDVLAKELKGEVVYEKTLALPGFHIFSAPQNDIEIALLNQNPPSVHFDLQFLNAEWQTKNISKDRLISFTAALQLPAAGGGLNYWDIFYEDYQNRSIEEQEILFQSKERHYCPYQEGKIVIHNGFNLHQIAVPDTYQKDDLRITLQGHAIRFDNIWKIYW